MPLAMCDEVRRLAFLHGFIWRWLLVNAHKRVNIGHSVYGAGRLCLPPGTLFRKVR